MFTSLLIGAVQGREIPALYLQLLFVIAAMAATFLLVPRGFSAGEIDIQSDHMSWNTTKGTYQLNLLARIPINNPNFLNVSPRPHFAHLWTVIMPDEDLLAFRRMTMPDVRIVLQIRQSMTMMPNSWNMQGKVSGQLKVFFYDTEAGARDVGPVIVPARASPQARPCSNSHYCKTLLLPLAHVKVIIGLPLR